MFWLGNATPANTVTWGLGIPNQQNLVGLSLYLQASAPAPGQNPGQRIVSNGLAVLVGSL